jgi:hypothetical protein
VFFRVLCPSETNPAGNKAYRKQVRQAFQLSKLGQWIRNFSGRPLSYGFVLVLVDFFRNFKNEDEADGRSCVFHAGSNRRTQTMAPRQPELFLKSG